MFNYFRSLSIIFLISLALLGCATGKVVKTYEGKALPDDAIAILTAPENITLISVNGVEVQQYLLSNLKVNYGLKAGENLVVFKYESIWSKAKKDQETGARVDVVESEPMEVLIPAKPGGKYNFSFVPAENIREAKILASHFSAQVIDQNKNLVTTAVALNTHQKAKDALLQEQQALLLSKQNDLSVPKSVGSEAVINQLKQLWLAADADEKKAFLAWVFQ